jgi:presenilin-like A22 family membrane protease
VTWEFRSPVELPLWGNVIVLIVVVFLLGFIVRDTIEVYKINHTNKHRKGSK